MRIDVVMANIPKGDALPRERESRIRAAASGIEMAIHVPHVGPSSITSRYEDALAVPQVVKACSRAEQAGADAVVVNCTADTGVEAAREVVSIPVVGVTEAAFHLASQLSHRFSVLTFSERTTTRFEEMALRWGLNHKLASVRSVEIPLYDFAYGANHQSQLVRRLVEAAMRCVQTDGAHLIILGCTAFEMVSEDLTVQFKEECLSIPILQPYLVGLRTAEILVRMGLLYSRLTYPPISPLK
jgi:allantoin racemase